MGVLRRAAAWVMNRSSGLEALADIVGNAAAEDARARVDKTRVANAPDENPIVQGALGFLQSSGVAVPWLVLIEEAAARRNGHVTRSHALQRRDAIEKSPALRGLYPGHRRTSHLVDAPPTHKAQRIFERPTPFHPWQYIMLHLIGNLVHPGDAYFLIVGPEGEGPGNVREPRELWPLEATGVQVIRNPTTRDPITYQYRPPGGGVMQTFSPERIVHVFSYNPNDTMKGRSSLAAAGLPINQMWESGRWNLSLLRNMAKAPGTFKTDIVLTDVQFEKLKSRIHSQYGGARNAGKTMVVDSGADFKRDGFSPDEMDWQLGIQEAKREIAVALNVAPELVGDTVAKTFANALHARMALYEDTVIPKVDQFREALESKLRRWWPEIRLELDLDAVPALQERRAAMQDKLVKLVERGIVTRNEARLAIGFEEVEGADSLLVPMNLVPLEFVTFPDDEEPPEGDPDGDEEIDNPPPDEEPEEEPDEGEAGRPRPLPAGRANGRRRG